jgi:hypothetical protein
MSESSPAVAEAERILVTSSPAAKITASSLPPAIPTSASSPGQVHSRHNPSRPPRGSSGCERSSAQPPLCELGTLAHIDLGVAGTSSTCFGARESAGFGLRGLQRQPGANFRRTSLRLRQDTNLHSSRVPGRPGAVQPSFVEAHAAVRGAYLPNSEWTPPHLYVGLFLKRCGSDSTFRVILRRGPDSVFF